jgi:hypothetical protein
MLYAHTYQVPQCVRKGIVSKEYFFRELKQFPFDFAVSLKNIRLTIEAAGAVQIMHGTYGPGHFMIADLLPGDKIIRHPSPTAAAPGEMQYFQGVLIYPCRSTQ